MKVTEYTFFNLDHHIIVTLNRECSDERKEIEAKGFKEVIVIIS